jgi:hypothetical protein
MIKGNISSISQTFLRICYIDETQRKRMSQECALGRKSILVTTEEIKTGVLLVEWLKWYHAFLANARP